VIGILVVTAIGIRSALRNQWVTSPPPSPRADAAAADFRGLRSRRSSSWVFSF